VLAVVPEGMRKAGLLPAEAFIGSATLIAEPNLDGGQAFMHLRSLYANGCFWNMSLNRDGGAFNIKQIGSPALINIQGKLHENSDDNGSGDSHVTWCIPVGFRPGNG